MDGHGEASHENYIWLLGKCEADAKQVELKDEEEEGPHLNLSIRFAFFFCRVAVFLPFSASEFMGTPRS